MPRSCHSECTYRRHFHAQEWRRHFARFSAHFPFSSSLSLTLFESKRSCTWRLGLILSDRTCPAAGTSSRYSDRRPFLKKIFRARLPRLGCSLFRTDFAMLMTSLSTMPATVGNYRGISFSAGPLSFRNRCVKLEELVCRSSFDLPRFCRFFQNSGQ